MKCSYQSDIMFDQSVYKLKVVVELEEISTREGEGCASGAFHPGSQVVQIHKSTRDDQQSHYSPEETFSEDEHKVCVVLN